MRARHFLAALTLLVGLSGAAQPQWRFHLAFEDATGARDTIWLVYDVTATSNEGGVDTSLGEGAVEMNPGEFNVWMYNWDFDSTKTLAYPYTEFPHHGGQEIHAFNYEYPIILRWDPWLFQAPDLPPPSYIPGGQMLSEYFFWNNNEQDGHAYILGPGWGDSVVVDPPLPQMTLFPLTVNLGVGSTVGIEEAQRPNDLAIRPNPAHDRLKIDSGGPLGWVRICGADGRTYVE
ncbi:MAG: hypothetical protein JST66_12435, partial [Bacteroidetes bacterium]|nr:hypothetical protein [Bacteroidota bacterium]